MIPWDISTNNIGMSRLQGERKLRMTVDTGYRLNKHKVKFFFRTRAAANYNKAVAVSG